ncbi:MAG: hypothetical protein WBG90_04740 [Saonia sp.]
MAISIDSLQTLQGYLLGVLDRADHHAGNVEGIALTLAGAIIWKSSKEIEVREYKGETANMIWFWVGLNRYAMLYNHTTKKIDLRERTYKGKLLNSFDNSTAYSDLIKVFKNL